MIFVFQLPFVLLPEFCDFFPSHHNILWGLLLRFISLEGVTLWKWKDSVWLLTKKVGCVWNRAASAFVVLQAQHFLMTCPPVSWDKCITVLCFVCPYVVLPLPASVCLESTTMYMSSLKNALTVLVPVTSCVVGELFLLLHCGWSTPPSGNGRQGTFAWQLATLSVPQQPNSSFKYQVCGPGLWGGQRSYHSILITQEPAPRQDFGRELPVALSSRGFVIWEPDWQTREASASPNSSLAVSWLAQR